MDSIMVSVICNTYNHEKYIAEALDSFVKQKTTFPYEILVVDDASTDRTSSIIRDYANRYSNIIPIILKNNCRQNSIQKFPFYKDYIHGKYIALCEGDDFWSSDIKLQLQYDSLEQNTNCKLCVHNTDTILEDGKPYYLKYPGCKVRNNILSTKELLNLMGEYGTCFRWSSLFFYSKSFIEYEENQPEFKLIADVGDGPLLMYLSLQGDIYYLDAYLSTYRKNSIGGWTLTQNQNRDSRIKHYLAWDSCLKSFDTYTDFKYESECEKIAKYWRYCLFLLNNDYNKIVDPGYRLYFNHLSVLRRVKYWLKAKLSFTTESRT